MCSCASRPTRPARSEIFCRTGGSRQTRPRERRPAGFSADLTPGANPRASLTSRASCDRTMRDQNRSCEGVRMETVTIEQEPGVNDGRRKHEPRCRERNLVLHPVEERDLCDDLARIIVPPGRDDVADNLNVLREPSEG